MFGHRSRQSFTQELRDWVDDVDVGHPVDTGAEEEVRALMAEAPLPVSVAGTDYEDTVPRALPPRVPKPSGLRALANRLRGGRS
jgi:hypothetical protein